MGKQKTVCMPYLRHLQPTEQRGHSDEGIPNNSKQRRLYICVALHAQSCPVLCDPKDCNHQAPLSMAFFRKEYWNGLLSPPPKDLPNPGTEPMSPQSPALAGGFFTIEPPGKAQLQISQNSKFSEASTEYNSSLDHQQLREFLTHGGWVLLHYISDE